MPTGTFHADIQTFNPAHHVPNNHISLKNIFETPTKCPGYVVPHEAEDPQYPGEGQHDELQDSNLFHWLCHTWFSW